MAGRSVLRGRSALLRLCILIAVATAAFAAAGPAAALATEAPIAAWSFDEGHGEVVHDLYGSHDGELEHASWDPPPEWHQAGRFGGDLRFQGQGYQCVNVPQSSDLELQEAFTIETWVKPEGTGVEEPLIFKEAAPGHEAYEGYMLYLGLESNGKVGGYVEEPGYKKPEVTSGKLPVGKWTHLALTFDGGHLRLYVDGELVDTTAAEGPQASKGPLKFGCSEIYGQDFEGQLDEVRIYDRALSGEEIGHDMTTALQTPNPSQAPVAEYSFDEDPGGGTTVPDLSGEGRDATIHGATWTPRGRYGGAMEFDAPEHAYLSISPGLQMTEELTLEAWVRPDEVSGYATVFADENSESPRYSYLLYDYTDRAMAFFEESEEGRLQGEGGELPSHTWVHLALTDDGAQDRLYVDGTLVDTEPAVPLRTTDGEMRIGGNGIWGEYFNGRIDEVRIYDRALSGTEVAADMETPIQTPKQGPVAEYSFDELEEGATTVEDASGDGHTATIEGATPTPHGRYGGAMEFDGGEDCVSIPVDEELQASEEFTIEAWVRPEGSGEEALPVIAMDDEGSEPGEEQFAYELFAGQDAAPKGWVRKGSEEGTWSVYGEEPLPEKSWSHLTLTDDGHEIRLYVDGKLGNEENSTDVAPPLTPAEGPLTIGCGIKYGSFRHFRGRIDEVRVYDRALDGPEVAADTETPIQTPRRGPVAAYSFDEGTEAGDSVEDVTGDGNEATIEGATRTGDGKFGGALEFDGEEGCLSIPASPELQLSEELTLEAWVRPEGSEEEAHPVITQEDPGASEAEEPYAYELLAGENEKPKAWVRRSGSGFQGVYGEGPLPEKVWSHLALTDDGAHLRLYVDGRLVDTETAPALTLGSGDLKIGCGVVDGTFQGRIDEVKIYERALSTAEVDGDMDAPIQTPASGPVAEYSFDEGEGETVEDLSGDGNTATIHGARWTPKGRYGGAMEFPAREESYLSVPDSPELDPTEEFTIEAWVRPDAGNGKYAPLVDKTTPGSSAQPYFLYEGSWEADLPYGGLEAESEAETQSHAKEQIPDGAWTHVALTFDGAKTRLYVNGHWVDSAPGTLTKTSEGDLLIGADGDGDFFEGRLDELRIYDRVLHGTEVAADMETPIQTPRTGPVAAWPFDEGLEAGPIVEDVTGDGHDGTIEGASRTEHGRYGGALEFQGKEDECVTVPESAALELSEELTIEAWVKPSITPNDDPIVFKENYGYPGYAMGIGISSEGKPEGLIGEAGPETETVVGPHPIEPHVWTHLAFTYDGAHMRLYVNGELVATKAQAAPPPASPGILAIGCNPLSKSETFDGRVDEVKIYERALSANEIGLSMQAPPTVGTEPTFDAGANDAILRGWVSPNGEDTIYYFEYGTTTGYGEEVELSEELLGVPAEGHVEVSEAVVNLTPETTYHYRLVAVSPGGVARGADQTVTTGLREMSEEEEEGIHTADDFWTEPEVESAALSQPLSAATDAPAISPVPDEFFGMMWSGNYVQTEQLLEPIRESHAKMLRLVLNQPVSQTIKHNEEAYKEKERYEKEKKEGKEPVEPTLHIEDETESSDASTKLIAKARARGLTVLPYLGAGAFPKEAEWGKWIQFGKELVTYYGPGGRVSPPIRNWEIWNEPNMPFPNASSGEGKVNPHLFGEFFARMSSAIRNAAPDGEGSVNILTPGLFGYKANVGCGNPKHLSSPNRRLCHEKPETFLAEMGHAEAYDAVSLHPYVFHISGHKLDTKNLGKVQDQVRSRIVEVRQFGKPVWVTEDGFPHAYVKTKGNGEEYSVFPPVSDGLQARLTRAVFGALKDWSGRLGIRHAFYYNIADGYGTGWESGCGLYTSNGKTRLPAYGAFKKVAE